MLAAAPARITAITEDATPAQLRTGPTPNDWSANDVLAHLRSCADVWGDCIAKMLAEDHPTIRAIDPRSWTPKTDYPDLEFRFSLAAFTKQRTELLAVLSELPPEDWPRTATLTGAGKPQVRTVHDYAQRLVVHERPHLKQVERNVKALRS
jgi:hypothetical protein